MTGSAFILLDPKTTDQGRDHLANDSLPHPPPHHTQGLKWNSLDFIPMGFGWALSSEETKVKLESSPKSGSGKTGSHILICLHLKKKKKCSILFYPSATQAFRMPLQVTHLPGASLASSVNGTIIYFTNVIKGSACQITFVLSYPRVALLG